MREWHSADRIDIGVGAGGVGSLMAASAIDSFRERPDRFIGQ